MDSKKYAILLPPALIIFILFFIYLPSGHKQPTLIVPIVFWTVYHIWVFVDRKNKIDKTRSDGVKK